LFGQAASLDKAPDANAAADSLSKRLDSLRLFDGQADGSKVQVSPRGLRSPRLLQAGKAPQIEQQHFFGGTVQCRNSSSSASARTEDPPR
jgi:hypothetical protein